MAKRQGAGDRQGRRAVGADNNLNKQTFDGSDRNTTCGNWTRSGDGAAVVGHHDHVGLNDSAPMKSWNSSHPSRGCSQEALRGSGGDGLFYCFAVN